MKRLLLTFALIGAGMGVANAQTIYQGPSTTTTAMPSTVGAGPTMAPLDPNGRPYVGANDWHRSPGDPMPSTASSFDGQGQSIASQPSELDGSGNHPAVMRDEFGFRYDGKGNRLDSRGNIISPHSKTP